MRGALGDVGALLLTGSVSLSVLATTIVRLTCLIRKRGQIVDLRKPEIEIKEDATNGAGYLIVIGVDGKHEIPDVCGHPLDLAALLVPNRASGSM